MLGDFEYLLLTAAVRLGEDAYGAAIRKEIENTTGRRCSIGALYTTLDRLETKGLLVTWMGDATPQRGGRAKRMVRVTEMGIQAGTDFYEAVRQVTRVYSWEANQVNVPPMFGRICWWLMDILSRALRPDERESGAPGIFGIRRDRWTGVARSFGFGNPPGGRPMERLASLAGSGGTDCPTRHVAQPRLQAHSGPERRLHLALREQL